MDTNSEEHRAACEIRWLANQSEKEQIDYCKLVEKHRGREAAKELYRAAQASPATHAAGPSDRYLAFCASPGNPKP
jgi:hypothetical protein